MTSSIHRQAILERLGIKQLPLMLTHDADFDDVDELSYVNQPVKTMPVSIPSA